MAKNEKTSGRVGKIAGRILETMKQNSFTSADKIFMGPYEICTVAELKALAASALTQVADKPVKKKAVRK